MDGMHLTMAPHSVEQKERSKIALWEYRSPAFKSPSLYVVVVAVWATCLIWFHPRLWSLMEVGDVWWAKLSIAYFVFFAELAWLYGIYNVAIVAFAALYRTRTRKDFLETSEALVHSPSCQPVAVLYTTCNDFVERSAQSCVEQDYDDFRVYILDDSSDPKIKACIDAFAHRHCDQVEVIRRPDRRAAKAGNLNHALAKHVHEPFFAVVDADEVLPPDFLAKLAPRLEVDPSCGFVQANHRASRRPPSNLARDMGVGVDIHWKWYQPLRNKFGFVMFLGHGAVLRRSCWLEVGGFPEIVSEDLGYAIALRERGYHGFFAEDVICDEEFPDTVRAFRVRHVKWTRGTCEFLWQWMPRLLRARRITTAEKLDILFPTLNLPMTFFFFLFMVNAQFLFPFVLGEFRTLTLELGGAQLQLPILSMKDEMNAVFGMDFYAITVLTVMAPVLCFIVELWRRPWTLLKFLTHSAALYAALSPLTFISVLGFAVTRKARFLVTGDVIGNGRHSVATFWSETHPDSRAVRGFEFFAALTFAVAAIVGFQISFLGLAIGFALLPIMHSTGWSQPPIRFLVWLPFSLILAGIGLGSLGIMGIAPVFFGFGFHF